MYIYIYIYILRIACALYRGFSQDGPASTKSRSSLGAKTLGFSVRVSGRGFGGGGGVLKKSQFVEIGVCITFLLGVNYLKGPSLNLTPL